MNPETTPPEGQMMQFILGKWISKPIHMAAKLGVADILHQYAEGNSIAIEELARRTDTNPEALYRLMRALAAVGIFEETQPRYFGNTALSTCLMTGRLRSAALMFHAEWHDKMWDQLEYSIRTGKPAFDRVHGAPAFDWFDHHPRAAAEFNEANNFKAAATHGMIIDAYDFSGIGRVTDVGGGLGGLMFRLLAVHPHLQGAIAERPPLVPVLHDRISKAGMADRLEAVACDFFKQVPAGSDAYLLSNILHDWPDNRCREILRNCRLAMGTTSRLIVVEAVIPPGNEFSVAKLLDLEVLLMGGGRERTRAQFRELLQSAGFSAPHFIVAGPEVTLIEAQPSPNGYRDRDSRTGRHGGEGFE